MNFHALDPLYPTEGLSDVSKGGKEVWELFDHQSDVVAQTSLSIRRSAKLEGARIPNEDEEGAWKVELYFAFTAPESEAGSS